MQFSWTQYARPTAIGDVLRRSSSAATLLVFCVVTSSTGVANAAASDTAKVEPATTGDAADVAAEPIPTKSLLDMFKAGGLVMYPILACSFVLGVFVLERSIALRRGAVIPRPFVKRFLEQLGEGQLEQERALTLCEENVTPVARVFAAAVRKWGRPAVEVEQAIIDSGERVTNDLRRHLRVINGISTLSPLLGLLGTVMGIITAFNAIATVSAMGHPELLAGGISESLITTAAGLIVAIPAMMLYLYFVGRVDRHIIEIDALGQRIVDLISAEALRGERADRSAKAARKTKAA
jgi:biopolymer transport protein ExbB